MELELESACAASLKARRRFCKAKSMAKCDLESFGYIPTGRDTVVTVKTPILRDTIYPAKNGCTYFVSKYPSYFKKPYEVVALCQGGRRVTGLKTFATKREAKEAAKRRAEYNMKKRERGYY